MAMSDTDWAKQTPDLTCILTSLCKALPNVCAIYVSSRLLRTSLVAPRGWEIRGALIPGEE